VLLALLLFGCSACGPQSGGGRREYVVAAGRVRVVVTGCNAAEALLVMLC
jgi:hypothetical protein